MDLRPGMTDLTKKKRIRAGYKASVTKTMTKVDVALSADPVTVSGLPLLRLTMKLEVIRILNAEVIELVDQEEVLTTEIQQADEYSENMHSYLLQTYFQNYLVY